MTAERLAAYLHEWPDYYLLAGIAATLLGLLFVAITLNADLILSNQRLQTRYVAEQAFQNYIAALLTALLFLFPDLTASAIAGCLVAEGSGMMIWVLVRAVKTLRVQQTTFRRTHLGRRLAPSLIAYAGILLAGIHFAGADTSNAAKFVGFATIPLLVSATVISWDLLVRVAALRQSTSV
jgi:hypothetical protein